MTSRLRHAAGFLLGLGLFLGPALAYWEGAAWVRKPTPRHDYAPPPHRAEDRRFRIVAFGSSSTRGFGASSESATYPARLQAMIDAVAPPGRHLVVFNRGVNGEDIDGMLARLDDDILPRDPALVLWQLGSNDALHDIAPEHLEALLRDGIARLREAGSAVVLIGPQWNPDPTRRALFEAMRDVVLVTGRDLGVPVVDRYALMQRWIGSGVLQSVDIIGQDGLHLTDLGYALMARAVFETMATEVPAVRVRLQGTPPAG